MAAAIEKNGKIEYNVRIFFNKDRDYIAESMRGIIFCHKIFVKCKNLFTSIYRFYVSLKELGTFLPFLNLKMEQLLENNQKLKLLI